MKALNQNELRTFVAHFNDLLAGGQLQDILSNDRGLALGFRHQGAHYWMLLDLVPNQPMMLLFKDQCPFKKSAKPKPLSLFLSSHGKNLLFGNVELLEDLGRVVRMTLRNSQKQVELELQLIPKQVNLIVRAEGKSISWEKPLELKPANSTESLPESRSVAAIHQEWLAEQGTAKKPALDPVVQWEKQRAKDIEKKRKALAEIQKQIDDDKERAWYEAGEWLKSNGFDHLPEKFAKQIDPEKSLGWNMENCFAKAKQVLQKKAGAEERLAIIEKEIQKLEKARYQERPPQNNLGDLMKKTDARGRKLNLASGAIAYCGKSGADNLLLLRQAKAWDYWLHLKDYPGAHAIIHRGRDQVIGESEILEVAQWVAKESLASKTFVSGQRVAVVMVETRFVRPIKGDKLGRVTYHGERTLSFTLRHT